MNGKTNSGYANAHLSYKGMSIVIDYEKCLHNYVEDHHNMVPFEVYPYCGDVYVDYVNIDPTYHKIDLNELINIVDKLIEDMETWD